MDYDTHAKPPVWYWIVGAVALLWNLMGVMAFIGQARMTPETAASMTEVQLGMMTSLPAWYMAAFGIAVFAGALGCVALLLRKALAFPLFAASMVGVIAQQAYHFFLSDISKTLGSTELVMTVMIVIVAALLLWFAKWSTAKGYLR